MGRKIIKVSKILASPREVYEALTNKDTMKIWSGDDVINENKEGGTFSLWGGSIHGVNTKLSPSQILQDWKEESWETYSKVAFNISSEGVATRLELVHEEVPDASYEDIDSGWDNYYFEPIKKLLEKQSSTFIK